ncbi:MAG: DUF1549 and DUF1553 domain-containing protein [Planctomycetes bacterium]|nr:DUF1549 and DUF1553 domain-containing protein [Planctomycetota bacterium]
MFEQTVMRISLRLLTIPTMLIGVVCAAAWVDAGEQAAAVSAPRDRQEAARAIDRFIDDKLSQKKIEPLPITGDEQFVRRIYLDVVGRIPTLVEARAFLDSKESGKRARLIESLLQSAGHVSHQFNFWADILRVKEHDGGISRAFYINWIKDSLASNKAYDQFVRELVTASGSGWQRGNGAVGYYFRDRGMPLDNMANTLRIFAGTRVACAQCHDHPHDRWTRRQMFEMAAFTANLTTDNTDELFKAIYQVEKATTDEELRHLSQVVRNTYHRDRVLGTSDGTIQLPADYQYPDAKPGEKIAAHAIFGPAGLPASESPADYRDRFGDWLTSPENPRFTSVIANRLWRRVMGRGLIEPVDDLRDDTKATHPELLEYLTQLMKDLRYDMRAYMLVLYNTQTYQRSVDPEEPDEGESNYFRGRLLTRMTAEQAWDSLMTLVVPEVDTRESGLNSSVIYYGGRPVLVGKEDMHTRFDKVKTHTVDQHWEFVVSELKAMKDDLQSQLDAERAAPNNVKPIYNFEVRASELGAPAAPGHFLRTFGQSNREFIEGGSKASNVTQFMPMFNGLVESQLLQNPESVLMQHLASKDSPSEKCDIAFLSILSRLPTDEERAMIAATSPTDDSWRQQDVVWALLNSQEFLFVE